MQNVVINMCEKFHCDRLRNDRALGNGKSDNNKNNSNKKKNNVRSAWRGDAEYARHENAGLEKSGKRKT